jgi:two-component system sensor histidine kinase ChiS
MLHHKVAALFLVWFAAVQVGADPSIGAWMRQSPSGTVFLPQFSLDRVLAAPAAGSVSFSARLVGLERGVAYVVTVPHASAVAVSGADVPVPVLGGGVAALFIAGGPEATLSVSVDDESGSAELGLRGGRIRSLPDAAFVLLLQFLALAFLACFSLFRIVEGVSGASKAASWNDEAFYALASASFLALLASSLPYVSAGMIQLGLPAFSVDRLRAIGGIAFLVLSFCGMARAKPFRFVSVLAVVSVLLGAAAGAGVFLPFFPAGLSLSVFSAAMLLLCLGSAVSSFIVRRRYIGMLCLSVALAAAALLFSSFVVDPGWESALSSLASVPFLLLSLRPRISLDIQEIPEPVLSDYVDQVSIALTRFVPKEFLAILDKSNATDLRLGDHVKKNMTIFFSDIRSFTTLSESLTPEENFRFINSYLSRVVPVVNNYGGFVDKYIGDAIMALFPEGAGADSAVSAAIEMQKRIREYNVHRASCGYRPLSMGIGIHTGTLMLGVVGVENRMQSTVISDAVNLASRLESITKVFNVSLAISEETFKSLADPGAYKYRFIGKVRVKGKTDPVSVFEIFDGIDEDLFERKMRAARFFEQGMLCYYQKDFHGSMFYFRKVLEILPEDGASAFYLDNCLAKVRL